jgi:hypothetical protein
VLYSLCTHVCTVYVYYYEVRRNLDRYTRIEWRLWCPPERLPTALCPAQAWRVSRSLYTTLLMYMDHLDPRVLYTLRGILSAAMSLCLANHNDKYIITNSLLALGLGVYIGTLYKTRLIIKKTSFPFIVFNSVICNLIFCCSQTKFCYYYR